MTDLREIFGDLDIYLFDQLLRGRITPGMRVLDAGCGSGRNLVYLRKAGRLAVGVDRERTEGCDVRGAVETLPFPAGSFDCVISNAVLHFAPDTPTFEAAVRDMWRVLAADGLFFARLASDIGIEDRIRWLEGRRALLPDGSERFLVDEAFLLEMGEALGGTLLDPIKTTNVQGRRCMTTWVLRKTG